MAQDPTSQSSHGSRRASIFISVLWLLVAVSVVITTYWILQTSRERMLRETEQDMGAQASANVAQLTVWFGNLKGQIESFTGLDLLRLFAAEVYESRLSAAELLELSRIPPELAMPDIPDVDEGLTRKESPGNVNDTIEPRLPMILSQVKGFQEKSRLLSISLLNKKFDMYISTDAAPQLSDEQRSALNSVIENRTPVFFPVRKQGDLLVMDAAFPVLAPLYHPVGEQVVSLLLVTCDVQSVITSVTRTATDSGVHRSYILQRTGKILQVIDPTIGLIDLPQWRLEGDALPLDKRHAPTAFAQSEIVYTLALPVPDMSWLVGQSFETQRVEGRYETFRRNIIIIAALVIIVAAISLAALWWWLVGSRARAAADQTRRLFLVVNQQKQIMDGVNSALSACIVLNDLNGVIYYANQSFARMVGMSLEQLSGLSYTKLPSDMARSLVTHTLAVHKSNGVVSFTEVLPLEGGNRSFLTSCSPFRDEHGQITGVVSVYNDIMDLILAQQRAQHMITQTVAVFVRAIEAVDPYLCGQSSFTAALAVNLAKYMEMDDESTLATLRVSASLSHIGMIQLPRELLNKTEALSTEERNQLQMHVEYSRRALAGIDFGIPVLETIYQMCERMDGSGYPNGLKGEEICMNSRILAVANTFCAMMRPRSYRTAFDIQRAMDVLTEAPPKYDMQVIQALRNFLQTDQGREFYTKLLDNRANPVSY